MRTVRQGRTGITAITVSILPPSHARHVLKTTSDTQYCDGLRGPIVIYDPNDPQASLYDVDDGKTLIIPLS
jgi:hypothetical protein